MMRDKSSLTLRYLKYVVLSFLTSVMLLSLAADGVHSQSAEAAAITEITAIVMADFDNSGDIETEVDSIVIEGDLAIAAWVYGEMGGTYVLSYEQGQWRTRCMTGGVFGVDGMQEFCALSEAQAQSLWNAWIEEEVP